MKRLRRAAAFMCAAAVLAASGCGEDTASSAGGKKTESKTQTEKITETCIIADKNFETYVSNTYLATGNNYILKSVDNTAFRAYIPLEEYGELEYSFYFSNSVDSTYDDGSRAYVGQAGGAYTISSAYVYDGGTSPDDEIGEKIPVTFSGSEGKAVASSETFWSDPVTIDIPEGHYLVWEWTLTGEDIPCIKMSNLTSSAKNEYPDDPDEDFVYTDEVPLPVYVGAKRDVKGRVTAIGDSITQGCMTDYMTFEFWAARIAKELGPDHAFYNAGLGWARASDCAANNNWLGRALNCDYAIVAFGTNDIGSGAYGAETGDNADDINGNIKAILEQFEGVGAKTILFNSPPQDYTGALEDTRVTLNELEKTTAESVGAEYFDFAACLSTEDDPSVAVYGGHPNAEGGAVVCEKFMEQFAGMFDK
ncbi:MAG: SGNH/GDSL hydrolase family protein [Ruminococcus sp.]|nr:SGNH/GDSL hydrolase family protein [Ruminococcus sp.]